MPGQLPSLCCPQPPSSEELPCSGEAGRENLLHQAMQNSGIVLERVTGEEGALEPAPPAAPSPQPLGDGPPELPLLEVEPVETVGARATGELLWGSDLGYKVATLAWQPPLLCSLGWTHHVPSCSDSSPLATSPGPGWSLPVGVPWLWLYCSCPAHSGGQRPAMTPPLPAGGQRGLSCAQDPPMPSVQ